MRIFQKEGSGAACPAPVYPEPASGLSGHSAGGAEQ